MMTGEYSFKFSREEAVARAQALTQYWQKKHGINSTWNGNKCQVDGKIMSVKFTADISVEEDHVVAKVDVGFLAAKLGGKDYVDRKVKECLNPEITLEQLKAHYAQRQTT